LAEDHYTAEESGERGGERGGGGGGRRRKAGRGRGTFYPGMLPLGSLRETYAPSSPSPARAAISRHEYRERL